ncbi:MAG: hypothetical protein GXY13_08120 [Acidimicrobiales bacterium]|nr:hypothetical protein [Acidimicrobiales bacterium]
MTRARAAASLRRAGRALLPLLTLTAGATLAWVIASELGGHEEPFFAPIAAVVALSSPLGERGSNAVRLLLGVLIGISAGELTVFALGGGYGRLALATFAAMAVARLLRSPRLVIVQAAAGAILTVAAADGEAGPNRLVDALIGAAVALVFSQILLSPEPVALVRRTAADVLARMADALDLVARSLERGDDDLAEEGLTRLRDVRDTLTELARLRRVSGRVARHSAIWRSRIETVVQENENAGHLDLLGASGVGLARAVVDAGSQACSPLTPLVQRLAGDLRAMAADPGDRATRQAAADSALAVARDLPRGVGRGETEAGGATGDVPLAAVMAVEMVALDLMIVAGVEPAVAAAAVRQGHEGELPVSAPPPTSRHPFVPGRRARPSPRDRDRG